MLQTTFHSPLAYSRPNPPLPIFVRFRPPTVAEMEQGLELVPEKSFYRNAYAMVRTSLAVIGALLTIV